MEVKTTSKLRVALFKDKISADTAYSAALKRGYKTKDIYVIMSHETKQKYFKKPHVQSKENDKSMEGLALDGALDRAVSGVIGSVVALNTTITIPSLGLVIAGPLATDLMVTGTLVDGLTDALKEAGLSEEQAKIYEKSIKGGDILMGITSYSDEDDELLEDWKKYNGQEIF